MSYYRILKYIEKNRGVRDDLICKKLHVSENDLSAISQGTDLDYLFRYPSKENDLLRCSELTAKGAEALEQMKTTRLFGILSCVLAAIAAVASIIGLFLR